MPSKENGQKELKMFQFKFNFKRLIIWALILLFFLPALLSFLGGGQLSEDISTSQGMQDIKEGRVQEVDVMGDRILLKYSDTEYKMITKEPTQSFTEMLTQYDIDPAAVNYEVKGPGMLENIGGLLNIASFLLMIFFLFILFRQARGAQSSIFSFGRSKAKLFAKGKQDVRFADVAGVDEAKRELEEVVDFLKHPGKYRKLGARTPKGALLVGPAGVGKTLMARAVAGEAGVPYFSMAGSEFMEMLVGVGASRVRDLFETAKKAAPSIIFIDEMDAIGRVRGMGTAGGHDEREQTLNQILVEMDGFTPKDNVVVLAATNRPDVLDPALVRPGRFDRRVTLDMPDREGRKAILAIHAKGKPFTRVDWDKVASRTVGFSGADIENMLNEAAITAARKNLSKIGFSEIEEAATKVKLGPEKRRMQSKLEREMTAYHEAGHAVVTHFLPTTDPVHRISIVSRGMALGFTLIPPEADKYQITRTELLEKIAGLLGGRAAEELVYGELTAGASSDIQKVTNMARKMVVEYGMSALGPIDFGPQWDTTEWGRSYMEPTHVSEAKLAEIDSEVRKVVDGAYEMALAILKKKRTILDKVAKKLVDVETLEREDFEKIVKTKKTDVKGDKEFRIVV